MKSRLKKWVPTPLSLLGVYLHAQQAASEEIQTAARIIGRFA